MVPLAIANGPVGKVVECDVPARCRQDDSIAWKTQGAPASDSSERLRQRQRGRHQVAQGKPVGLRQRVYDAAVTRHDADVIKPVELCDLADDLLRVGAEEKLRLFKEGALKRCVTMSGSSFGAVTRPFVTCGLCFA